MSPATPLTAVRGRANFFLTTIPDLPLTAVTGEVYQPLARLRIIGYTIMSAQGKL